MGPRLGCVRTGLGTLLAHGKCGQAAGGEQGAYIPQQGNVTRLGNVRQGNFLIQDFLFLVGYVVQGNLGLRKLIQGLIGKLIQGDFGLRQILDRLIRLNRLLGELRSRRRRVSCRCC